MVVVFEFSLENSAVAKAVSFLFMERTPPRLVVLPIGALTFASVGVLFGTAWLLVAYGQNLLRIVGLRFLTLCLVLRLLGLLLLLFATFAWLSRIIVFSIDGIDRKSVV